MLARGTKLYKQFKCMEGEMKKRAILCVFVLLVLVVWCVPSYAAIIVWVNGADVTEVAVIGGNVRIKVQNAANTIQKYVDPTQANEILATALTAYSMGSKVNVRLDTSTNEITAIVLSP